jgi:hypothetical protein
MAKDKTNTDRRSVRKKLSPVIKRQLLMEAGYRCGNPRCTVILAVHILEDHHIKYVSEGGGDELSNLLALCPNCHTLYHHGEIPHEAIRHWKGMLLALNHAFDRESMDLLLYLVQTRNTEVWYTGDGILRFAKLIARGLVAIAETDLVAQRYTNNLKLTHTSHRVALTESGVMLLEAWLSGDEKKFLDFLGKPHLLLQEEEEKAEDTDKKV